MNDYNPNYPCRRSIRLKGFNYAQEGLYFITLCCQNRECLFGEISNDGEILLNDAGKMIKDQWLALPKRYENIRLHEYIVMPNHFHAILEILDDSVSEVESAQEKKMSDLEELPQELPRQEIKLGDILSAFKSITTVEYIRGVKTNNWQTFDGKLWQRNYWEHIIRNEKAYDNISDYIINNPQKWVEDSMHP